MEHTNTEGRAAAAFPEEPAEPADERGAERGDMTASLASHLAAPAEPADKGENAKESAFERGAYNAASPEDGRETEGENVTARGASRPGSPAEPAEKGERTNGAEIEPAGERERTNEIESEPAGEGENAGGYRAVSDAAEAVSTEPEKQGEETRENSADAEGMTAESKTDHSTELEELQRIYPQFEPQTDGASPAFTAMVAAGVPARTAYEALHLDDLLTGAMQYAARRTMERLAGSSLAGRSRPQENGLYTGQPARTAFDPRTLTPGQARDLRERVYRGEKIYL